MHLLFNAMHISWAVTGCGDPYLVSTIGEFDAESICYRRNSTDHRGILIGYDHNAHIYLSLASTVVCCIIHRACQATPIPGYPQGVLYHTCEQAQTVVW